MFETVAARLERAKARVEEEGRLNVAMLDAETAAKVAKLIADAKSQYPLALGAVSRVVPRDQLDAAVDETVTSLIAKSAVTLALGRDAFYAARDLGFDAALDRLQAGLTAVSLTEDSREGVLAFVERREPRWSHH